MILIFDEWNDIWIWVLDSDHNIELSPHFDTKEDAIKWQKMLKKLFTGK